MAIFKITPDFEKLALSHYGNNGGNINSQLWFCALEWGGGISADGLKSDIQNCSDKIPALDDVDERVKIAKNNLDQKILKIYAQIKYDEVNKYREALLTPEAPFTSSGEIFKLNLYPISFPDTNSAHWTKAHYEITGFPTKELYLACMQEIRFSQFKKYTEYHKPKVIVCCGSSHSKEFLMAFAGVEAVFSSPIEEKKLHSKSSIKIYQHPNQDTKIIITPFFGNRYGISKNEECAEIGNLIKKFL